MSGLIEEIQRDALDSRVPIEALLRRVKLAAAKLDLQSVDTWVHSELFGYSGELPSYRRVFGQAAAWNPYNGWIPVQCKDERLSDIISEARIAQPVAGLRDLLDKADGVIHFPIPSGLVTKLNEIMDFQTARMVIQISRGHVVGILDTVRSMVLEWAVAMEKRGVLGDGLSFDRQERDRAQAAMTTFHISHVGSFIGNVGSGNTIGSVAVSGPTLSDVLAINDKISAASQQLANEGANLTGLIEATEAVRLEAKSATPSNLVLRERFLDMRAALAGAAGNLISEGALSLIATALKLLS